MDASPEVAEPEAAAAAEKAVATEPVRLPVDADPEADSDAAPAPDALVDPDAVVDPALGPADRERLLHGTHHDPHSVLGAHPVPGGIVFRALRPYARSVTVLSGDLRAELHDDGDGFFSGLLPLTKAPVHRLLVTYESTTVETEDAYRFLPTLGDLDLHLIGEGRHEQLWTVLGARPTTHQGVSGTAFSVWAPNARGVRLAGTFNFWDGTGYPMRSLGSSGVWELFVPGIGEGELYKFDITRPDGSHTLRADPMARRTEVPCGDLVGRARLALRVGRRGVAGPAGRDTRARGPVLRLRAPSGLLAAGAHVPATGRSTARVRPGPRLHACRADAGRRASLRRFMGLPGHRFLRAHRPARHTRRLQVPGGRAAPSTASAS